jgi:hypothetical protein
MNTLQGEAQATQAATAPPAVSGARDSFAGGNIPIIDPVVASMQARRQANALQGQRAQESNLATAEANRKAKLTTAAAKLTADQKKQFKDFAGDIDVVAVDSADGLSRELQTTVNGIPVPKADMDAIQINLPQLEEIVDVTYPGITPGERTKVAIGMGLRRLQRTRQQAAAAGGS